MKERPILFSAPMVGALLAGTKTQTRRAVKLPHKNSLGKWEPTTFGGTDARGVEHGEQAAIWHTRTGDTLGCPYGQPGERLWVREAWAEHPDYPGTRRAVYRADPGCEYDVPRWRPSIHMPRWACRITLEITDVRVQRLQEITSDDAFAEGIDTEGEVYDEGESLQSAGSPVSPERYAFATLWRSINGDASWDANPWVWALTFKRVDP